MDRASLAPEQPVPAAGIDFAGGQPVALQGPNIRIFPPLEGLDQTCRKGSGFLLPSFAPLAGIRSRQG